MTDNEKRAHDLAVMVTQNLMQMRLEDHEENNKNKNSSQYEEFKFDTYTEYLKVYNALLKRFTDDSVSSN